MPLNPAHWSFNGTEKNCKTSLLFMIDGHTVNNLQLILFVVYYTDNTMVIVCCMLFTLLSILDDHFPQHTVVVYFVFFYLTGSQHFPLI